MKSLVLFFISISTYSFGCAKDTTILINAHGKIKITINEVPDTVLPVIVMWGQSNEEGANSNSVFPDSFKTEIQNAYIFFKPTNTTANDGSVQTIHFGVNNNWRVNTEPARLGPEVGMAKYLANAGKKIGIIKYAYQGSRLVDHETFTTGHWQIDNTHNFHHYQILVNSFVKPGLDSFRSKGYSPYIIAMHWTQGEADSQDSICASRYQTELTRLISQFKIDVPEAANMVTIATRTRSNVWPYSSIIRSAQMSVADYWIDSDTWPLNSDGIHYTRTAQTTLHGKAIADIIIPLIK